MSGMPYIWYQQTAPTNNDGKDGWRGKEGVEEGVKGGDLLNGPEQKHLRIWQISTILCICEIEGEEISLLDEWHPHYTKISYHSPPTHM
jgi:hypothetical protein